MVCPWNVVVVVCLRRVLRPEVAGGAYNTVGWIAGARNTVRALPRLERSGAWLCHILMVPLCRGAGHGV